MDNTFSLIVNDILASHPQIKKELYEAIDNKNVGFLLTCASSCLELLDGLSKVKPDKKTMSKHKKELTVLHAKCSYYRFRLLAEMLINDTNSIRDN